MPPSKPKKNGKPASNSQQKSAPSLSTISVPSKNTNIETKRNKGNGKEIKTDENDKNKRLVQEMKIKNLDHNPDETYEVVEDSGSDSYEQATPDEESDEATPPPSLQSTPKIAIQAKPGRMLLSSIAKKNVTSEVTETRAPEKKTYRRTKYKVNDNPVDENSENRKPNLQNPNEKSKFVNKKADAPIYTFESHSDNVGKSGKEKMTKEMALALAREKKKLKREEKIKRYQGLREIRELKKQENREASD